MGGRDRGSGRVGRPRAGGSDRYARNVGSRRIEVYHCTKEGADGRSCSPRNGRWADTDRPSLDRAIALYESNEVV